MSFRIPRFPGALLALLVLLPLGCTSKDNGQTSVIPKAPPVTTLATVRGTVVGVNGRIPKVTVQVFSGGLSPLTAFTTTSEATGRWSVSNLPAGTYRFSLTPPAPDPNDASTNLREVSVGNVVVGASDVTIPPVFFAPVVDGGLLIVDNTPSDQFLKFRVDPTDVGSAIVPGFESMEFLIRANTVLKLFGFTLGQLSIDDNPTTTTTRELLVEVAIVRGDQLPAPHIDQDGNSRASQAYYVLYPVGFDFLTTGTATRELEIDFPNVNGLSGVFEGPQVAFSFLSNSWNPAGALDVNGAGDLVQADNFDGPKQLGIVAAPGPPPPTTTVSGQIMSGGNPLSRAGISVHTNSGFTGLTDANGVYRIEDVPIPLNRADLVVTAYTDSGLEFASGSNVARPTYPTTTIDISLRAVPLATPNCILANSEPITGSVGVQTNARIRLRFDSVMDRDSLQTAMTVVATPDGLAAMTIPGTVVTESVDVGGGILHTDAFFVADDPLPDNASVVVSVTTDAMNEEGLALTAACSYSYRTGTSTLFLPRIDVMEPLEGVVGETVSLYGTNLDIASLTFDGASLSTSSKTQTKLTFVVPTSEGSEAPGPRALSLAPGGAAESFMILPRIDSIQFDNDPDPGIEDLIDIAAGAPGTAVAGVDQNDGTLVVINGQNLFDSGSGMMPLVTFGRGDGTAAGATDGDADIDGPDEIAGEQRIDVNVPPQATTGPLTVSVDVGGGTVFTSAPKTFVIDLPPDTTAPGFSTGNFVPLPSATNVTSSTVIRVQYDEAISDNSRLLVGFGSPPRQIPGETVSTTSLDGTIGFLEFHPTAGSLPTSSTIQVQLSDAFIFDLAGNPSSNFDYTFTTGVTEPTGGLPDGPRAVDDRLVAPVESELSPPSVTGKTPEQGGVSELVLRAAELGSGQPEPSSEDELAEEAEPLSGFREILFDSHISVQDETVADWGDLPPVARWRVNGPGNAEAEGLYLADSWGHGEDGAPLVKSFFRLDLAGPEPNPERHAYRFRLSMADGSERVTGMITDLDKDGRYELSLFSDSESDLSALARHDLVQVGDGFLEFELPTYSPPEVEGQRRAMSYFSIQSFDVLSSTYSNSPVIQLGY